MKDYVTRVLLLFLLVVGTASAQTIKMNEIYSNGKSATHPDLDWIELYNSSSVQVDVSGYKIYDNAGNTDPVKKMQIPSGTIIPAKSFYVVVTDIDKTLNGFGLSSSGEKAWLEDKTGALIDTVTFAALTEKQSYSRIPDGGNWKVVSGFTKGVTNGTGSSVKTNNDIPVEFKLYQNYPNPFNPETTISYSIPVETRHTSTLQHVTLKVYDLLGREVATLVNEFKNAGSYNSQFSIRNFQLTSGVYFYRLQCGSYNETKKLILMK